MRIQTIAALAAFVAFAHGSSLHAQGAAKTLKADDIVEIQQLYARYNWTIDAGDAEGWASTFTPDGVFGTSVGHDALVKFAETLHAGIGAHLRHWNTNLLVVPTPTGASGKVYLMLVDFATAPPTILRSGNYADDLVKTADGWRFKKRAVSYDVAPAKP